MTLLEKLVEKQEAEGLNDRQFAKRLGVSRALWQGTREGKVKLGIMVLAGAAREFPSLSDDVLHAVAAYKLKRQEVA